MKASEFNVNKVWDFIESRPFYNKNYMPKFNTAEEIWAEWGTAEKRMYAKFDWEDTYGNKLHPKEVANRRRQGNYSALAGLKESKNRNTMKASELKQIIREEIHKVLNENTKLNLKKNGIYILDGGLNKMGEWDEKSLKKANVLYYTDKSNDPKLEKFKKDGLVRVIIKDNSVEDVIEF